MNCKKEYRLTIIVFLEIFTGLSDCNCVRGYPLIRMSSLTTSLPTAYSQTPDISNSYVAGKVSMNGILTLSISGKLPKPNKPTFEIAKAGHFINVVSTEGIAMSFQSFDTHRAIINIMLAKCKIFATQNLEPTKHCVPKVFSIKQFRI